MPVDQMTKSEAQTSLKNVNAEAFSLSSSTVIELYEIDFQDLLTEKSLTPVPGTPGDDIFRFHNNVSLLNKNLVFNSETFVAAPIKVEGFNLAGRDKLPTPTLSIAVNDDSIDLLKIIKHQIFDLTGDLTGAKVTRIRTMLKFLDLPGNPTGSPGNDFYQTGITLEPDPNAILSSDVYFVDRKSEESANTLIYELASILDVEGVKLPNRLMTANTCMWQYRGEGCLYEFRSSAGLDIREDIPSSLSAVPVADSNDQPIYDRGDGVPPILKGATPRNRGRYFASRLATYVRGDYVYLQKPLDINKRRNYYFVCREDGPLAGPPNLTYWIPEQCSKTIFGCRLRWKNISYNFDDISGFSGTPSEHNGSLPYGGFPVINKVR